MYDEQLVEQIETIFGLKLSLPSLRYMRQSMGINKKPGRGKCENASPKAEYDRQTEFFKNFLNETEEFINEQYLEREP